MTQSLEQVYSQLAAMKTDLTDLRATYKGMPKSYSMVFKTLNDLTLHSSEAAKRSAKSTEQSRTAAMNAMMVAKEVSGNPRQMAVVETVVTAVVESAAVVAASTVAHQAEESFLKASSEVSSAPRMAADAAVEAIKLPNQAIEVADLAKGKA